MFLIYCDPILLSRTKIYHTPSILTVSITFFLIKLQGVGFSVRHEQFIVHIFHFIALFHALLCVMNGRNFPPSFKGH